MQQEQTMHDRMSPSRPGEGEALIQDAYTYSACIGREERLIRIPAHRYVIRNSTVARSIDIDNVLESRG